MDMNRLFDLAASIVTVALVTTLVLPDRRTRGIIREGGRAFSGSVRTAVAPHA